MDSEEAPHWDPERNHWGSGEELTEKQRLAIVIEWRGEIKPSGANLPSSVVSEMLAHLCPVTVLKGLSPEALVQKLDEVSFQFTPEDSTEDDAFLVYVEPIRREVLRVCGQYRLRPGATCLRR